MTRYARVNFETRYDSTVLYEELEDRPYTEVELEQLGQDMVNNECSWGVSVVDESEVPEDERQ